MSADEPAPSASPPQYGRISRPRGFLPLNADDASSMATHGSGTLTSLIKSRSHTSLGILNRRPSSLHGREAYDEEADMRPFDRFRRNSREREDLDDHRRADERRLSVILNGPQVCSLRLVPSLSSSMNSYN